jgi:3-methyl-2-oxobutanoate hydroxymethyltransferase
MIAALTSYADDVRTGRYPQPEHGYAMPADEAARLGSVLADRGASALRPARTRRVG